MTQEAVLITPAHERVTQTPTRVLLVAEGTYPHAWGGVSTWCDLLVRSLPDVRFWVWAITPRPDLPQLYAVPDNVEQVVTVPLWNVRDVKETLADPGLWRLHRSRRAVTDDVVRQEFLPAFTAFVGAVLSDDVDPMDLGRQIHSLYRYLLTHDLHETLANALVWDAYVGQIRSSPSPESLASLSDPMLVDASTGYAWLTRWLFPLARPIPPVDVVHAAMAGLCCMTAAAAVLEHGAGFLLTEHGVYLREQYLAAATQDSPFLKRLRLRFAQRMTELGYALAGQVSPCCDYNQRWEREIGAERSRLKTIYYGLDSTAYTSQRPLSEKPRTVVWVGRINPLKDVETLLRAAAVVVAERPDVRFLLYGGAPTEDADYHQRCLALHESLQLGEAVRFCGYTATPSDAYNEGDIVVMSSVSEGLPFSILEAMSCGRPIVATAVGGIPEGIAGAGIAVEPRNPEALGRAILSLADDPELCHELGVGARARATHQFGLDRFAADHRSSYLMLAADSPEQHLAVVGGTPHPSSPQPTADRTRSPRLRQLYVAEGVADEGSLAFRELRSLVESIVADPVDRFEVAAIIESGGVTDDVARARYGCPDTFSLAGALFESLHRRAPDSDRRVHVSPTVESLGSEIGVAAFSHMDSARHPALAVVPSAALLSVIWLISTLGAFSSEKVLSLALGMTMGMLCTNGIAMGMGRRASEMISLGKIAATRRFIGGCSVAAVLMTLAISGTVVAADVPGLSAITEHTGVFVLAAVILAAVWVMAAALSLVGRAGWTGAGLVAGVLVGVVVDRAASVGLAAHMALGVAVGSGVVLVVVVWAFGRELDNRAAGQGDSDRTLPAPGFLALEAAPYFLYGTFGVIMFASVHVIGWAAAEADMSKVTTLELGLFLTLGPVMLGAGRAERALRLFWLRAAHLQTTTSISRAGTFNDQLTRMCRTEMRGYTIAITAMSLLTAVILEVLLYLEVLTALVATLDIEVFRAVYLTSLVAFGLLGEAQFAAMHSLALARWRGPLLAIAAGTAVTIAVGVVAVATLGFGAAPLGLAAGSAVATALGLSATLRMLPNVDHVYANAL